MIVLVESHTKARGTRTPRQVPEAGGRWGRPSRFSFDQSADEAEMDDRGGITLIWPAERIETVDVDDFTPVWRKIDVVKLPSAEDPNATEEVGVTSELLFPISETRQKYMGGGTGYVDDTGGWPYEDRIIHTFLLLRVPSPGPDAEVLRSEEQGQWPSPPEEMFPPGTFVDVPPIPGNWRR